MRPFIPPCSSLADEEKMLSVLRIQGSGRLMQNVEYKKQEAGCGLLLLHF